MNDMYWVLESKNQEIAFRGHDFSSNGGQGKEELS
jgi:hypothetical protein